MLACRQKRAIENKGFLGSSQILSFAIILTCISCFFLPSVAYPDTICSRSAIVVDASTGKILYSKNPDLRLPPASTVKLMTAIIAIENIDLTDTVTVSKYASRVSPSKVGFKVGDKVTIETLLFAALVKSGNDAAVALAEAVAGSERRFVQLMNSKAITIGAKNTKFKNSHGLPASGQYTTAADLTKIMNYALMYPRLREIIGTRVVEVSTENGHAIFLKNTNKLLWSEVDLVGGKTGYTRRARHCFVGAAERGDDRVIVAVLGSPSRKTLWKESEMLIHEGFDVMDNGKASVKYSKENNDDTSIIRQVSQKKYTKVKGGSAKEKTEKNMVAKKMARHEKPNIERKKTEIAAKSTDKREKNYRIAEKRNVNNKG